MKQGIVLMMAVFLWSLSWASFAIKTVSIQQETSDFPQTLIVPSLLLDKAWRPGVSSAIWGATG